MNIPEMNIPDTTATPCACQSPCRCDDAPAEAPETIRLLADTIRAQDGRRVEAAAIASIWTVRHGDRCQVVAHLYPVTLAECDDYAEARAVQERAQAWLDSGRE